MGEREGEAERGGDIGRRGSEGEGEGDGPGDSGD